MQRILPVALVLAVVAAAIWLLAPSETPIGPPTEATQASHAASTFAPPESGSAEFGPPSPTAQPLLTSRAPGAAAFTLDDGTGRSLWLAGDLITLWRVDAMPARAVASHVTTTADVQLVAELQPGRYRAAVEHKTLGQRVGEDFDVRAGETTRLALPSGVPDASRRVTLQLVRDDPDFPLDGHVTVLVADGAAPPREAQRLREDLYATDNIGPSGCDVSVTWFRETPVSVRGVAGGSVQSVALRGTAELLVDILDPEGRPLARANVDVRLPDDDVTKPRASAMSDLSGRAVLHLPACEVTARIDGTWFNNRHGSKDQDALASEKPVQPTPEVLLLRENIVVQDVKGLSLPAAMTTAHTVHLEQGGIAKGEVRFETGEPGRATVVVLARREPPRTLEPTSPEVTELVARLETDGWRACAIDDASGFSFSGVPAGSLRLVAGRSANWFGAPVEIEVQPGKAAFDLVVRLPPARWIDGRFVAPPGASFTDLFVTARTTSDNLGPRPVEPDGRFRIGPLAPGQYSLALRGKEPRWLRLAPPTRDVTLGTVDLPADRDVERSFDLRDARPGSLDVRLHVRGPMAGKARVFAVTPDGASTLGSAEVDGEVAHLDNVFGNQVKLVLAVDEWIDAQPEIIDVPAWSRASVDVSVEIFEGRVRVQTAEGRPLAGRGVYVGQFGAEAWRTAPLVALDAQGCARVRAPASRLWFSLESSIGAADEQRATLRWPPEDDQPAVVILRD